MFADVEAARALRDRILRSPSDYLYPRDVSCPICGRVVSSHNATFLVMRPDGRTYFESLPCWRRGEWDRYGLHVAPTPLSFSHPGGEF